MEMKQQRNRVSLRIEMIAKEVPNQARPEIFPRRLLEVWSFDICFGLESSSKALVSRLYMEEWDVFFRMVLQLAESLGRTYCKKPTYSNVLYP
jgi:hypothetical protein